MMLVPNCPGAKLSGAKLPVFIIMVPSCPVPNFLGVKLSCAKLSYHLLVWNHHTYLVAGQFGTNIIKRTILKGLETSMMMIELHSSWFEKCDRPRANCSYTLSLEISSCNLKCLIRIQNLEHEDRLKI